jgi:hypothetical protein
VAAANGWIFGVIIAMTSGGTDYRVWRFSNLFQSLATLSTITSIANTSGIAASWTVTQTNVAGATSGAAAGYQVVGTAATTIRWFASCWYIDCKN